MSLKFAVGNVFKLQYLDKVKSMYKTHPQFSTACTGFITFSVGDVIAQKLDKNNKRVDLNRALQLGLLGVVMNGFFLHRWFILLDKVVGKTVKNAAIYKVVADQVVYAPFAIISFFGFACIMKPSTEELKMKTLTDKVEKDFVKTYIADCTIWPAANFINFSFVPLIYRASFTAVTQLVWQTYLSIVTHHMNKIASPHTHSEKLSHDSLIHTELSSLSEQKSSTHLEMSVETAGGVVRMNSGGQVHV